MSSKKDIKFQHINIYCYLKINTNIKIKVAHVQI